MPITQKILNEILENNGEKEKNETFLFYCGISFGLLGQKTIEQRTLELLPLEILSVSACINFHLSCEHLIKFILDKSNIKYEENTSLFQLFSLLSTKLQKQIFDSLHFEMKYLKILPSTKNLNFYEQQKTDIIQIFHFLNYFQKRVEAVAMDIKENNLFL